jgi:hypothetical protein
MSPDANRKAHERDPLAAVLATFRRRDRPGWDDAWVGMEPTFQSRKSVKRWEKMSAVEGGEDAYFTDRYMLRTQRAVARAIAKRYRARRKRGHPACLFDRVTVEEGLDQWKVHRQNLEFKWADEALEDLNVRFTIDPETFEYSIKPVPLAWFYDERWVRFLEDFLWRAPRKAGLEPSIAHGGAQFSLSAKTYLQGSLLADDIADKLNHPELSTWIMDWPNPDDRAFRATGERTAAFRRVLEAYWRGAFHPKALGGLTPASCYFDRGFGPAAAVPAGLMGRQGPRGDGRAVFQTNFAFGRAVRWQAQNVQPGYWQVAGPKEEGYRPDQIMRYGEGNLNRLQIAGELHVKSGAVLDPERVPELGAPLDVSMLTEEASWENRGQMGRTSARDFVEALLLDVHNARWLQRNPRVAVKTSLVQDQLLGDGEATLKRHGGGRALDRLRKQARADNLEASEGRIVDDFIEPETLFWAAWRVLPKGEKAAVAREVVTSFVERVERAAAQDPRPAAGHDVMEWHRHRVHPILWEALAAVKGPRDAAARELAAWQARREEYLARRPIFSPTDLVPPWA